MTTTRVSLVVFAVALSSACGGDKDKPSAGEGTAPTAHPVASGKAGGGKAKGRPAPVDKRASRGPEHAVFSLVDNRLLGHVQRHGGLVVRAGSAGFAKYLRFRKADTPFEIRQKRDGTPVARLGSNAAAIHVPLSAAQGAGEQHIRVRHYNAEARRMTVRVNGKDVSTVEMPAGWGESDVTVPAGRLAAGENEVLLFTSKGEPMEVDWIQVGGTAAPSGSPALYDPATKALVVEDSGGVAFYVMVPDKGRLVGDVTDAGCKVAISAEPQRGAAQSGVLAGTGDAVDLAGLSGQVVRLELRAQGCERAGLANAALVVPGEAPALASRGDKPKYVVFWIMDSLRADRIRTFVAGARPEVPTFDAMLDTSTFFVQTYVQGNESRVSHASMWSALYPAVHDMLSSKAKLAPKWKTIDEVMDAAGMFTSGVSGNGYIVAKWGFGTAWDEYRNHIHQGGGLNGEDILARGLKSVEGKTEPWFLYLGTIDTHVSWRAKEPWLSKYDTKPYSGKFKTVASGADMGAVAGGKLKITERDKDRIRAIYDSNVSYQDDLVRQLFEKLDEWGIRDQTMVVITADHGDEQWEAGRVGHGGSLRESLVHVPLIVHYPPMFPAGKVVEGTEVIDIVPTLADVMGVDADAAWQGSSLLPLAHGVGRGYPRMAMASQYEGAHAARLGPWKIRASGGNTPAVYNLVEDPAESKDRIGDAPYAHRFVADALWMLRTYNAEWKKSRWGNAANVTAQFAADMGE